MREPDSHPAALESERQGVIDRGQDLARLVGTVLAAWGSANVLGGGALVASGRGPATSAFGQQSAAWGSINLAIAGLGLWRSRRTPVELPRLRTILLANALLDLGYVVAGTAIMASVRGRTDARAAARRGHGAAIVVQGAGLEAIDSVFAVVVIRELHRAQAT